MPILSPLVIHYVPPSVSSDLCMGHSSSESVVIADSGHLDMDLWSELHIGLIRILSASLGARLAFSLRQVHSLGLTCATI